MNNSDFAIGIIFWYKRKGKYYLSDKTPKLPFENWGAFYVFEKRFSQVLLEKKNGKYQWTTKEQILKALRKDGIRRAK